MLGISLGLTSVGVRGRSFSPLDLSPVLWLDATTGLYQDEAKTTPAASDGDVVGAWEDQSGNGNDATQSTTAKKPLLKTAIQNGKDVVRFDGSDDFLQTAAFSSLSQPNTIVSVNSGNNRYVYDGLNASERHALSGALGGSKLGIYAGASLVETHTLPYSIAIFSAVFSGAGSELYENGALFASGDAGSQSLTGLKVGTLNTEASFLTGDISELLVFDGALSTADREELEQYLADRWGITLS